MSEYLNSKFPRLYKLLIHHTNYRFTSFQAFKKVLKETNDFAGQRETVAENLQAQVLQKISLLSKNLRDERKKSLYEGTTLQQNLSSQLASLDRAKRNYEKTYRDAEKAIDNYQKADADFNLSRAEVEKQKTNMTIKIAQADEAKKEYANQLQKTNMLQESHFRKHLPEVISFLCENQWPIKQFNKSFRYLIDCKTLMRNERVA